VTSPGLPEGESKLVSAYSPVVHSGSTKIRFRYAGAKMLPGSR